MLVSVLESLDQSDCLLHIPTYCVIVNLDTADNMFVVQDEHSSDRGASHWIILVRDKHTIILANLLADVGHQWIVDRLTEASLRPWRLQPRQMREVAIARNTKNFRTEFLEFIHLFTESNKLRRAHVREVKGIKD